MEGMIGEIRWFAGNFAPRSWAFCDGQLLAIASNTALFSILGTTYGGDGRTTFALPDFRGRTALGTGNGPGLPFQNLGEKSGSDTNTLTISNMASHNHAGMGTIEANNGVASNANPATLTPSNAMGRNTTTGSQVQVNAYGPSAGGTMAANSAQITLSNTGGGQPVNNIQPSLGMNYIICEYGIYPSRG